MKPVAASSRRRLLQLAAGGTVAALGLPAARAEAWPSKPVKIVVTFPPGGSSDVVARIMGEFLPKRLGQPVVVDNRPGAGGTIGGSAVMQSPADGYTLMLSNTTPIALGPFALDKQPYDPVAAFTHVASLGTAPLVIMANCNIVGQWAKAEVFYELEKKGLIVSGTCPDNGLVEMIELPDHPWFVGCQFHPELKSRATTAHPLFRDFVRAAVEHQGH